MTAQRQGDHRAPASPGSHRGGRGVLRNARGPRPARPDWHRLGEITIYMAVLFMAFYMAGQVLRWVLL